MYGGSLLVMINGEEGSKGTACRRVGGYWLAVLLSPTHEETRWEWTPSIMFKIKQAALSQITEEVEVLL